MYCIATQFGCLDLDLARSRSKRFCLGFLWNSENRNSIARGGWDESCVTQNDYMARFFRIFNWRSGRPFSFEPITLQIGTLSSYIISTSYLGTPRPHTS